MEVVRKRRFVEYCAEAGRIRQVDLAEKANVSQVSISRIIRGQVVASQTRAAALIGLNAIRKERRNDLADLLYDDILWTWE